MLWIARDVDGWTGVYEGKLPPVRDHQGIWKKVRGCKCVAKVSCIVGQVPLIKKGAIAILEIGKENDNDTKDAAD